MNNDNITLNHNEKQSLFDATRWGLPKAAIDDLANRLRRVWNRFKACFTTKARDTSQYAFIYMRGLLTMDTERNYANISRRVIDIRDDGQNIQQFMSDSPWNASGVFDQIQSEVKLHPQLNGGMLTLDGSGDKRAGSQSAGTAGQHIGRPGKVDMGQVGVAPGYYQDDIRAMVDAQLYLPQEWFDKNHEKLRKRLHIPAERTFASKADLGPGMIRHAKANQMQFEVVGCDTTYGRDSEFRRALNTQNILYMADIPNNIHVYLTKPEPGVPANTGQRGRPCSRMQEVNDSQPIQVSSLAKKMTLTPVTIRHVERGMLVYECSSCRIWTISQNFVAAEEWLLVRREANGDFSYSLSNAPEDVSLEQLAYWRCERYFAERIFQDVKTEGGWDELVARKYRAWEHHTGLDALTLWFIAETKPDWSCQYPRDPELTEELGVCKLPALSMSNVREMLKAVLPLPQLSIEEAIQMVVNHLVNRSHSTSCRLKAKHNMSHQSREP
jgi:SRSO17 transposase